MIYCTYMELDMGYPKQPHDDVQYVYFSIAYKVIDKSKVRFEMRTSLVF